jgi:protein-L-isoaspartate(D-aspartate) O-methyltransferase
MDIERARFNMVEQQIRPWDVLDTNILELLFHVKREEFVSDNQRALAFTDTELPLPNGARMLQPKQEARMIQDLGITATDKILEIGTGSGYVTALLSSLGAQVFSLDTDVNMLKTAGERLNRSGFKNVQLVQGNGLKGLEEQAPFDAIFVGGSVPVVPETLKNQLAVGGRMILTVGKEPVMTVRLVQRASQTTFQETILYETCIDRLSGCEAIEPEGFVF